ncbi:hypothetical protein H6P81_017440 [Aristolochia fimbriata]|uniref:Epidermal patterning factor-like protein n=1 Tax=Aristolochia fimbriata TaxID=158543 RepID=A0AAV7E194_ARIFI|nr:hypothetical protein H6P81_017440 [Aristolochia fimbriata]
MSAAAASQKPFVCLLMLVFLLLLSFWEAATSRTVPISTAVDHHKQDSSADSLQYSRRESKQNIEEISSSINGREGLRDEVNNIPIGSGPPNCYLKCNGCTPCDPVLVTVPLRELVGTQAENYPQIWKCQCGHDII